MMRKRLASPVLAAAALAIGAGPAGAHGGDAALVHSCISDGGIVKVIAADESCKKSEVALDWARNGGAGGETTYTAGAGLSLSAANEFSVTGAPWGGLTGVPAGFADGVDDEGPDLTWGNLTGIPSDLLDGDDDGSAAAGALATQLATDDGVPNEAGDPVSFSKVKDLTSASGDGRITGEFVRDGSITAADIRPGTIDTDRLAPGVLDHISGFAAVDPPAIPPGTRVAVEVQDLGGGFDWGPEDIVTVSPPAELEQDLVYAGSHVDSFGTLSVYLHNINLFSSNPVDGAQRGWRVHVLKTGG